MYNERIIRNELSKHNQKIRFIFKKEVGSTNDELDILGRKGEAEVLVMLAESQSGGKGRMGRSFHSPKGSGIYMSLLLRPPFSGEDCNLLTPLAAAALCDALESVFEIKADIKWVNDIYLSGKKAAGILTKAAFSGNGKTAYVIVGIGINLTEPDGGFHEAIKDIAVAVKDRVSDSDRNRLVGCFLKSFMDYYEKLPEVTFCEGYKKRLLYLGEKITVREKEHSYEAAALDIDDRFRLKVCTAEGKEKLLYTEEISIRKMSDIQS